MTLARRRARRSCSTRRMGLPPRLGGSSLSSSWRAGFPMSSTTVTPSSRSRPVRGALRRRIGVGCSFTCTSPTASGAAGRSRSTMLRWPRPSASIAQPSRFRAKTPMGCSGASKGCTGSCASLPRTQRSGARPPSRAWRCCRSCPMMSRWT